MMAAYEILRANRAALTATRGNVELTARRLQLGLAGLWLLDGALQYQPFMFTKAFSGTLADTASGNPALIAGPISWNAGIVGHHPVITNAIFATIQLLLAVAIACRRTVKVGLAATVVWSAGVWWFGEGLGGVLTGAANPVSGAPGAVILYALIALLLWPSPLWPPAQWLPALWPSRLWRRRGGSSPSFVAARPLGGAVARLLWLTLWGSLAYLAIQPFGRMPQGLHDTIAGMAEGEPFWIARMNDLTAAQLSHHGGPVSISLAVVFAAIAAGIYLPAPGARAALVCAVAVAAVIWVAGQDFGAIFTGSGTDPNTGPLLALLAACYWPVRAVRPATGSGPARLVTEMIARRDGIQGDGVQRHDVRANDIRANDIRANDVQSNTEEAACRDVA